MPETDVKEKKLTAEQKWGFGLLVFFGLAVLIFGMWQFSYRIQAPFAGRGAGLKNFKDLDQQKFETMIAKQARDTDQDGLSDFDEEYVYKTSPYLDDSDSDGFLDKQEVESGNDPNCPSGKNCGLPEVVASGETGTSGAAAAASEPPEDLSSMQTILSGRATAEEIRATLRASGVSEDVLSKVDDKTLLEAYADVLVDTNSAGALENINLAPQSDLLNVNAATNSEVDALAGLSPADVRELLRQAGVDEAVLSQVDDETLMQILREAMKQ